MQPDTVLTPSPETRGQEEVNLASIVNQTSTDHYHQAMRWLLAAEEIARGDGGNLPGDRATWVLALTKLTEIRMKLCDYEGGGLGADVQDVVEALGDVRDSINEIPATMKRISGRGWS